MASKWMSFKNWSVTAKLITLFGIFGIIPMAAIGMIAFQAATDIKGSVGTQFQDAASTISDKIDRNLAERYGDVQAFALNDVLSRVVYWGDRGDYNEISKAMNKYIEAYAGTYYLTMMVDPAGNLMAVNYKDETGKPIDTSALWEKNYKNTKWFQALEAGQFTTKMPFTAEGNDKLTGTFIEDVHVDQDVKAAYGGIDALTIGFSSPVYNEEGEVIAYWSNRAKFSLVEKIFKQSYQDLKSSGYPNAELTLVGDQGQVLIDYDPGRRGTSDITHDFENVLFKLNLAEKGIAAAQKAVAGESGYLTALHARKQIQQVGGYTHLDGALGYPGMNWSVLVRVPEEEAAAGAIAIQEKVLMTALVCLGLILPIGWYVGRKAARGLLQVSDVAQLAAQGDLTQRIPVNSQDEVGKMSEALNTMFENVAKVVRQVSQGAEQVASASGEISQGNDDLSQRTSEQASSLEETSASMEEMTSTVKQNADNAKQANQLAIAAREVAEKGGRVTTDAVQAMDEINKSSKKIADIINVIDEIAFQTNLLALNAAVEAARAGEQGRGFAVVASEVRNLAQRSASAAKEIKDLINESVQKVGDGSELVNQSGKTLEEIVGSVKRVTDIISEISAASQEQSSGIDQVNKAIMQMDQTTQENAALVEQAASSAQSMKQQSTALQREVAFFKTSNSEVDDERSTPSPQPKTTAGSSKPATSTGSQPVKPKAPAPAPKETLEPVGVGAGNGFDRRSRQDDAFEEF